MMKCRVICPKCHTAYRVDPRNVRVRGSRVSCHVCSHQWILELEDLDTTREKPPMDEPEMWTAAAGSESGELDEVECPHCGKTFRPAAPASAEPDGRPDLIILDLKLENGPRDGHFILSRRERRDIPVLVLTGEQRFNMHSEDWFELEKLGARDIIEKNMNIEELLVSKVRTLLQPI